MNKEILKYVDDNDWELKHNVDALSYAAIKTANLFSDIEPMKVIKFMLKVFFRSVRLFGKYWKEMHEDLLVHTHTCIHIYERLDANKKPTRRLS